MKICPQCKSKYTDVTLTYCLQDGAALEDSPDEKTLVLDPDSFADEATIAESPSEGGTDLSDSIPKTEFVGANTAENRSVETVVGVSPLTSVTVAPEMGRPARVVTTPAMVHGSDGWALEVIHTSSNGASLNGLYDVQDIAYLLESPNAICLVTPSVYTHRPSRQPDLCVLPRYSCFVGEQLEDFQSCGEHETDDSEHSQRLEYFGETHRVTCAVKLLPLAAGRINGAWWRPVPTPLANLACTRRCRWPGRPNCVHS